MDTKQGAIGLLTRYLWVIHIPTHFEMQRLQFNRYPTARPIHDVQNPFLSYVYSSENQIMLQEFLFGFLFGCIPFA